ncbi:MAG: SPOR domain-containing protein [Rhodocyclales bacterium]|nr:SPOR domain-containing protein [Rhodocyclales bacterium]
MRNPAPAKQQPPRGKSRGGIMLGLFIGLVVGILAAFGVVWYLNKTPLPFQDKSNRAEKPADRAPGAAKTPEPLPGKPGDKVGEKPRFEFYKILPGGQEALPSPAAPAAPQPAAAPAAEAVPTETLYLQAGAFQKAADADSLRAKLSLMGVEVGVQEVVIPDKGTLYRVRVGPYARLDEMNRVRNQLAESGLQTTLVKVK